MKDKKNHGPYHVASLVLGIVSIVAALFWYIAIPTGVLAIVFGVKSYKRFGSKLGCAGLITGIVGLSLCALIYISFIIIIILENNVF